MSRSHPPGPTTHTRTPAAASTAATAAPARGTPTAAAAIARALVLLRREHRRRVRRCAERAWPRLGAAPTLHHLHCVLDEVCAEAEPSSDDAALLLLAVSACRDEAAQLPRYAQYLVGTVVGPDRTKRQRVDWRFAARTTLAADVLYLILRTHPALRRHCARAMRREEG